MNDMSEEKKGGPYTKPEQEKRRMQVYQMYFEKGRSALSIARELGVNRNTVNEDVRFLCKDIASVYKKERIEDMASGQMERIELQRERLTCMLDSADNSEKIRIEKMIFDMDYKMFSLITKYSNGFRHFEYLMFDHSSKY
tara:strand:- start:1127 stop:1546 length:420 start_codon:yes stop_codon:yes gene_type:complete